MSTNLLACTGWDAGCVDRVSLAAIKRSKDWLYENMQRSWGSASGPVWAWDPFPAVGPLGQRRSSPSDYSVINEIQVDESTTWEEYEEQFPEHFEPILETRPGRVADSYPQDVTDENYQEDEEVATTWTEWGIETASAIVGNILQPDPAPMGFAPTGPLGPSTPTNQTLTAAAMAGCDGMQWSGGTPPKGFKVVNHCGVGVLRRIRRRRRPRIATNSDLADISAIVGIVGKGQLATALISRRGR